MASQRTWRAPEELAERLAEFAEMNGISQNEAITRAVTAMVTSDTSDDTETGTAESAHDATVVPLLLSQLKTKDEQIASLTKLLDQQQQVTAMTARRSFSQAIKGLFSH